MTQPENAETNSQQRSRYDRCDPHYLRELREAAGMDWVVLARTACLSVAQVKALESESSGDVFYSDTIKRQAYKRLLMILGAEPPTVEVPAALRDAHEVAEAHLNTLDQIVAMSHQPPMNYTLADRLRDAASFVVEQKQLLGPLLLLVSAVVLFVLYGPLHLVQEPAVTASVPVKSTAVAVSEPASATAAASSTPTDAVTTAVVSPAAVPVASSSLVAAPVAVATASASSAVASALTKSSNATCAYSADALPQLAPFVARKEGGYVYVVSNATTEVCVVDGNKQATLLQLKAGEGRTVTGAAPWQLSGAQLKHVQIYFQGGRVTLPEDIQRLMLVEQPVAR